MNAQNHYADEVLDRVAQFRRNNDWVNAQYAAEHTMVIPVWRSRSLIEQGAEPRGVMMSIAETRALMEMATTTVLLGVRNDIAHFAIDISTLEAHEVNELRADGEFVDLRSVGAVLDRTEASILAYAKGIMHWHSRHLFCGVCGSPTESQDAGRFRRARREPRTGGCPRGDGGIRRPDRQYPLSLVAALAVPVIADAGLFRRRGDRGTDPVGRGARRPAVVYTG